MINEQGGDMSHIEAEISRILDELVVLQNEINAERIELANKISEKESKELVLYYDLFALIMDTTPILSTIEISPNDVDLRVNQTVQMKAICKDQHGDTMVCPILLWQSSNTNVATVDPNGLVSAVGSGFTDIIATTP